MATFNIDTMKADFAPVDIHFRGQDYVLGACATGVLDGCEVHGTIEDKDGLEYMRAFFGIMRDMVLALSGDLDLDNLDPALELGEQLALMKACSEVLRRVGRLTFQAEE